MRSKLGPLSDIFEFPSASLKQQIKEIKKELSNKQRENETLKRRNQILTGQINNLTDMNEELR